MKTTAQLQPVLSPLQSFRLRHDFSYQDLADCCEGAPNCSKTSISRLLNGQLDDAEVESEIRLRLAQSLPFLLFSRGLTTVQIDQELSKIFSEKEYKPMISARTILNKDAQRWFGLSADPFALIPQSREDIFVSKDLQTIFDRVIDAIKYQHFIAITGEIGSGKTTLRMLIEDYLCRHPELRLIVPENFDMSKVTESSIKREMLEELGEFKLPRSPIAQSKMLKRVIAEKSSNLRIALLFDEIHRVNQDTLPTLKNFWEMIRSGFRNYLGIILLGQPQFEAELNRMPEIKERLEIIRMPPFQKNSVDYLQHRITLVGGNPDEIFDAESLSLIARQANTPLALGNVANTALKIAKDKFEERRVLGSFLQTEIAFGSSQTPQVLRSRKVV
jgi:type II secretory pathway predicted ATPase ExeA